MTKLIFTLVFLVSSIVWAKVEFDSSQLMMQNAEQVTDLVKKRLQQAEKVQDSADEGSDQAEQEALEYLKDAMRIALARPDQDGLRGILFTRIRRELSDLGAVESTLNSLTDESLASLKDKSAPVAHHSTYIMILENLMAEIKPELEKNKTFLEIVERIRDAKVKVSKDVRQQQKLKLMKDPVSPSETAKAILPKKK